MVDLVQVSDGELTKSQKLAVEGAQYHIAGNLDAARLHYDAALLLEPDNPMALQNLSGILFASHQNHAAVSVARRAILSAPGNVYALANHAAALMHLGQLPKAQRELEEVLKTVTEDAGIWHNYSLVRYLQGHRAAALEALKKSIKLEPGVVDRMGDLGIFTLSTGDLQAGLSKYEIRWQQLKRSVIWDLGIPEWNGESIYGKKLLFHHEQGLGDGIMLVRFIKELRENGADVHVACPKDLVRLFELGLDDPPPIYNWDNPIPADAGKFDFHVPMLSALRWLGTQVGDIKADPYLKAKPFEGSLGASGKRIGICWESGDHSPMMRHRRRVVPLEYFFQFAELPNMRLVSLQKGTAQKDIVNCGAESFVFDPMNRVEDFYDTAQIISQLDMVVSVDSAVVHLAGAMGKPVVMLGPYTRCWRWWAETKGKPWYDDFKIFPQENYGDWTGAVKKAREAVAARFCK